jgi:hypothetical protein
MPLIIKIKVAITDRGERLPIPQTPCPLVQPPPKRVPKPTNRPLLINSPKEAVDSAGKGILKEPMCDRAAAQKAGEKEPAPISIWTR